MAELDPYEVRWSKVAIGIALLILLVIGGSIAFLGLGIPSHRAKADPLDLPSEFKENQIKEVSPGKYEVYVTAGQFSFAPRQIKIPAGSEVTFYLTATDVLHGFHVVGTNVNMMAVPGHVNSIKYNFYEPGDYLFVCNEYCGDGHHVMFGNIIVEGTGK